MANASSNLDVNRIHDDVKSLLTKKRARTIEMEDLRAGKDELVVEVTRRTLEKARELENAPEIPWKRQATEDSLVNRICEEVESLLERKRARTDRLAERDELMVEARDRIREKARGFEIELETPFQDVTLWVREKAREFKISLEMLGAEFKISLETLGAKLETFGAKAREFEISQETLGVKARGYESSQETFGEWQATEDSGESPAVLRDVEERSLAHLCGTFLRMMAFEMHMPWSSFLPTLREESLYLGGRGRDPWSGTLHLQLAEHLEKMGFSREDWDLSLSRKDGGDPMCTPEEVDAAAAADEKNLVSTSGLSKEQLSLRERIAIKHRSFIDSPDLSPSEQ